MKYYFIYLLIINLITMVGYAEDKSRAIKHRYRIKESFLLTLSIIGGAFGGYLIMIWRHHKTRKWYFLLVNILGIVAYSYLSYLILKLNGII